MSKTLPKPTNLPILQDVDGDARRADARALGQAQRAAARGDLDAALVALAPLTASLTSPLRASAALFAAGLRLQQGDATAALVLLQRLEGCGHAVDEGARHMLLAIVSRARGEADRAVAHARAACAVAPSVARRLVLADAHKHGGALDDAIATLVSLVGDASDCATAWGQLAGYHALRGDVVESAAALRHFDACAGDDADADRNRAFVALCRRDLDGALPHVRRALAREPTQTRAWLHDEVELAPFAADPRVRALTADLGVAPDAG